MQQPTNIHRKKKRGKRYQLPHLQRKFNSYKLHNKIQLDKKKGGVWGKKEKENKKKPWERAAWLFSQVYLKRIGYRCNSQTGSSCWDA